MSQPGSVLITSVSKKVPLVMAVKKAVAQLPEWDRVIGGDLNPDALSRYFVDTFWEMPRVNAETMPTILKWCQENRVGAIVPTRDQELSCWAEHKQLFEEAGIAIMVSDLPAIQRTVDKLTFYEALQTANLPSIPTTLSLPASEVQSWVVKERYGAGSKGVGVGLSNEEAEKYSLELEEPIFQPCIPGKEYSVDLYVDKNKTIKGVVVRERTMVVYGESQITTTVRNASIEKMGEEVAEALEIYGHAVLQVMVDPEDRIHIIECNSRFGGASTASLAVGLDTFRWFLMEAAGKSIDDTSFQRKSGEIRQVRYPSDLVIDL